MRRLVALLLLLMFAFSLSACNTLKGIGRDVEQAGEEIDEEI